MFVYNSLVLHMVSTV